MVAYQDLTAQTQVSATLGYAGSYTVVIQLEAPRRPVLRAHQVSGRQGRSLRCRQ